MNTVIVYAHPNTDSLSHAVLLAVQNRLRVQGRTFSVLDLYADKFNGQYTIDEYRLYHDGKTQDPLVTDYEAQVLHCEHLIFIFPIWWNDVPAIVKGFIDMVFKRNVTYFARKRGIAGNLANMKSVQVLTTSTSPTWYLKAFCGNAIQRVLLNGTFKQLGIPQRFWHNFGGVTTSSAKQRNQYLVDLQKKI